MIDATERPLKPRPIVQGGIGAAISQLQPASGEIRLAAARIDYRVTGTMPAVTPAMAAAGA